MSRDPFVHAVENELQHWPNVRVEWDRTAKHRKVTFHFGEKKRFITLPSSASDNIRGPRNAVTNMKSVLRTLGAIRRDAIPASKRQLEEEAVNMAEDAPVRIGISDTVNVVIPKTSKLFDRFADDKLRAKGHWGLELRSNPDLKAEPFLAIVPRELPPGKKRVHGAVGGTYNKPTSGFQLTYALGTVQKVLEKFGRFRTTAVEVTQNNGEIILKLPKERQPVILRGNKRLEALTAPPTPVEPIVEQTPPPEVPYQPLVGIELLAKLLENQKMPERMVLQLPERPLTVERCIDFLNNKKKTRGNNLRFTIDTFSGLLSYIEKGGMH